MGKGDIIKIKLTENETKILLQLAKIGSENLTLEILKTTRDRLDLLNVEQVLRFCNPVTDKAPGKTYEPTIEINVAGERVAGLNGKKWKLQI